MKIKNWRVAILNWFIILMCIIFCIGSYLIARMSLK
jgi:hypothetical protein